MNGNFNKYIHIKSCYLQVYKIDCKNNSSIFKRMNTCISEGTFNLRDLLDMP